MWLKTSHGVQGCGFDPEFFNKLISRLQTLTSHALTYTKQTHMNIRRNLCMKSKAHRSRHRLKLCKDKDAELAKERMKEREKESTTFQSVDTYREQK